MALKTHLYSFLGRLERKFETHNTIEVSRSALLHNLDLFAGLSGLKVIPVLKGNAYGHGISLVAFALAQRKLSYIAVDGYFEALRIREISRQPVLVMGAIMPANFEHLKFDKFAFVVQDEATIRSIGDTGKRVALHLECNTGMNRYGAKPEDLTKLTKLILGYKNLQLEGVMSHLADSDGKQSATISSAVDIFDSCVETIRAAGAAPTLIHLAQSAGSLRARSKYANAMRLGIGLYGVNPFPSGHNRHGQLRELRPALTLKSTITKIIDLEPGDKVSYNYTFTASRMMRIAILPLGYYEGVNRSLSNVGAVKIDTHFCPIVGRVCMNHTMIDLAGTKATVGASVTVISSKPGDKNSIDRIADDHGLFTYELLTRLSPDVRRKLVD